MFYFFYKIIIFHLNKQKDDMRSAYVNLVNSYNLETANCIAHAIFAIKTHVLELIRTTLHGANYGTTHAADF